MNGRIIYTARNPWNITFPLFRVLFVCLWNDFYLRTANLTFFFIIFILSKTILKFKYILMMVFPSYTISPLTQTKTQYQKNIIKQHPDRKTNKNKTPQNRKDNTKYKHIKVCGVHYMPVNYSWTWSLSLNGWYSVSLHWERLVSSLPAGRYNDTLVIAFIHLFVHSFMWKTKK